MKRRSGMNAGRYGEGGAGSLGKVHMGNGAGWG